MVPELTANLGKGLAAGLPGTVAMTQPSTLEMKLRDRGRSHTPRRPPRRCSTSTQSAPSKPSSGSAS